MRISVQREACRKMPQHARYGFNVHSVLQGQRSHGGACFRWTDHQFPVDSIYLFRDGKRFALHIQVRPLEGQQFPSPQARGQLQIEGREKLTALRFRKVHPDFLLRQNFHFPFLKLR